MGRSDRRLRGLCHANVLGFSPLCCLSIPVADPDVVPTSGRGLQRLDQSLFDRIAAGARQAPRGRRNHNLHHEEDLVQRFINVLQPGTYVRPHCHRRTDPRAGFECFVVLQGSIGVLLFDDQGRVRGRECLAAQGPLRGLEIAAGQVHTLVALSPDAVMLEIKQGPYDPTTDKHFMPGFPLEGTAGAAEQERAWRRLFDG